MRYVQMQHLKEVKDYIIVFSPFSRVLWGFCASMATSQFCTGGSVCQDLFSGRYNEPTLERPVYRILHLVFALGLAHALFLLGQEGVRAHRLAQERAALEAELRQVEARVAALRGQVEAAKDPAHLEALARRLGMVRKEEILKRR